MELNTKQKAIIEHTIKNGLFCGGSQDMDELCAAGLMAEIETRDADTDALIARLEKRINGITSLLNIKGTLMRSGK